jgi:hypothetical protein
LQPNLESVILPWESIVQRTHHPDQVIPTGIPIRVYPD